MDEENQVIEEEITPASESESIPEPEPVNYNSILISIKKMRGLSADYDAFDPDLISYINTAFFTLWQLGIGTDISKPFRIEDAAALWTDFIEDGKVDMCKTYMDMRVRMMFDPPSSSFVADAFNSMIKEFEWRMVAGMDEYASCNR